MSFILNWKTEMELYVLNSIIMIMFISEKKNWSIIFGVKFEIINLPQVVGKL